MSATVSRFVINDLNESLNEKPSWNFTLESNSGIDPALLKYNDCTTCTECRAINPDVATDVDENGAWNYRLYNLETGGYYYQDENDEYYIDTLFYNHVRYYDLWEHDIDFNRSLKSFNAPLPKLTDGMEMFAFCPALESFGSDLSNLTNGESMFEFCSVLKTFTSDLPNLTNSYCMFCFCYSLREWDVNLPKLTNGKSMFEGCDSLTSFESDLSNLTNGQNMFFLCASLTSFESDLSNLTNGQNMFYNCKLDTTSVKNIASTINTVSSGDITIGIGNTTPNTEEETAFNTIASKGWTVYVNGSDTSWTPTASTNLTEGEEESTPIPYYAKPVQVTEDVAEYVDSNNNYYNIVGGQFIYGDDISTYGMFTSYEHAVEEISIALGLTKYTNPAAERRQHTLNGLLMPN